MRSFLGGGRAFDRAFLQVPFPGSRLLPYIIAQVLSAIAGASIVYLIAFGQPNFVLSGSNPLAINGFDEHSPSSYSLGVAFITLVTFTKNPGVGTA
ncbi:hypothetical protein H6G13_25630 [Pseudanabaena sp. FACHB-2040]|nr:hypothetical protein [Pseudanabaena sp. FACHB-2040]MBD2260959.1 hypothetical protein [Pseudanabaena sp. FACHB-2040]